MTRLTNGTWVVVADGEKALFLENTTDGENPNLEVRRKDTQDNPSDFDQSANRPGRMGDQPDKNGARSAFEDTDWHQLAKERFAHELADLLYKKAHNGEFDRLVLVAAPRILGELRGKLHQEVSNRVVGEIPKTLTNHTVDDIEALVKSELTTA